MRVTALFLLLSLPLTAQSTAARVKAIDTQMNDSMSTPEGGSTIGMGQAYGVAETAFDKELNRVYSALLKELNGPAKEAFMESQRKWVAFRDAQFEAFRQVYDRDRFGSGQGPLIAAARMNLVRTRVLELATYRDGMWGEDEEPE